MRERNPEKRAERAAADVFSSRFPPHRVWKLRWRSGTPEGPPSPSRWRREVSSSAARSSRPLRAEEPWSPEVDELIVAVGSTRGPKVEAARRALAILKEKFPGFFRGGLRLIARSVPSGTAATPSSTEKLMSGARHRATRLFEQLAEEGQVPALSLGLEGGVLRESGGHGQEAVFLLESWAYATDGVRGYYGSGGCIALPSELAEAVVDRGEELGPAADKLYGLRDVAGRQGTFGVLTAGLVTREEAFVRAVVHALAPFYNASAYSSGEETSPPDPGAQSVDAGDPL